MELQLLQLEGVAIWKQLEIEEALLRADERNWCLINCGTPPAVIVGVSGKIDEWVDCNEAKRQSVPIYRRFSGGGTVVVDEDTLFVTLIGRHDALPFHPFPEPVMRWSAEIYTEAFNHPEFHLRENDYAIGAKKCGGNAQYLRKRRWLHHTSFLWDYCPEKMQCLQMPPRSPDYRKGRAHSDFLCKLSNHFSKREEVIEAIVETMERRFSVTRVQEKDLEPILAKPYRRATTRALLHNSGA